MQQKKPRDCNPWARCLPSRTALQRKRLEHRLPGTRNLPYLPRHFRHVNIRSVITALLSRVLLRDGSKSRRMRMVDIDAMVKKDHVFAALRGIANQRLPAVGRNLVE